MKIPRRLSHIWIGPRPVPERWMNTWRQRHPDFEYTLYDNETLESFPFRCRAQIQTMLEHRAYPGVADLMRYELLLEFGGIMPGADSICLRNTADLFDRSCAYTVYENEMVRGRLVSPILACEPGNPFVAKLVDRLADTSPQSLGTPWIHTGNLFCTQMIEEFKPEIEIFPSYYFNPLHYTGVLDRNARDAYAVQIWGSTVDGYEEAKMGSGLADWKKKRAEKMARRKGIRAFHAIENANLREQMDRLIGLFPEVLGKEL